MSTASRIKIVPQVNVPRHINLIVVHGNLAYSSLTIKAFKTARLTMGLHCVSSGEDAVKDGTLAFCV
jgi:hypothetical protein